MTTSINPSLLPSRQLLWLCRALCSIALLISGYLAWTAFNASEVYGCGGGEVFDCGHVLNSRYAKILGLPVSVPAFGMYAGMLAVLAFFRPGTPEKLLQVGWGILTIGALSAGLAAAWFTSIQVFELEHLCVYCLGAHACGLILAAVVIWKHPLGWMRLSQLSGVSVAGVALLVAGQLTAEAPQTFTVERYEDDMAVQAETHMTSFEPPGGTEEFGAPVEFGPPVEFAPPTDAVEVAAEPKRDGSVDEPVTIEKKADVTTSLPEPGREVSAANVETSGSSLVAAAFLLSAPSGNAGAMRLLSQFPGLNEPATLQDQAEASSSDGGNATTQVAAKPVAPAPVKPRLVTVAGRRFSLDTRHWPLLGDPDAKYVFVEMFDYTCPHCRHTHHAIEGAFRQFGDELAVIALPVPLERSCNPSAKGNGHVGACELAKLAVAVWRCDPGKFGDFHHWMFESARTTSQARIKAEQLVGKDRLTAELRLPHASSYISKHVELYKRVGSGAVPKLMFPTSTMTGQVSSSSTLIDTIKRELTVR